MLFQIMFFRKIFTTNFTAVWSISEMYDTFVASQIRRIVHLDTAKPALIMIVVIIRIIRVIVNDCIRNIWRAKNVIHSTSCFFIIVICNVMWCRPIMSSQTILMQKCSMASLTFECFGNFLCMDSGFVS